MQKVTQITYLAQIYYKLIQKYINYNCCRRCVIVLRCSLLSSCKKKLRRTKKGKKKDK